MTPIFNVFIQEITKRYGKKTDPNSLFHWVTDEILDKIRVPFHFIQVNSSSSEPEIHHRLKIYCDEIFHAIECLWIMNIKSCYKIRKMWLVFKPSTSKGVLWLKVLAVNLQTSVAGRVPVLSIRILWIQPWTKSAYGRGENGSDYQNHWKSEFYMEATSYSFWCSALRSNSYIWVGLSHFWAIKVPL